MADYDEPDIVKPHRPGIRIERDNIQLATSKSLDLPDGFDYSGTFANDSDVVAQWTALDGEDWEAAVSRLSLAEVRTALGMTEDVAREHRNRADRALELNSRLRTATERTAHHGLSEEKEGPSNGW